MRDSRVNLLIPSRALALLRTRSTVLSSPSANAKRSATAGKFSELGHPAESADVFPTSVVSDCSGPRVRREPDSEITNGTRTIRSMRSRHTWVCLTESVQNRCVADQYIHYSGADQERRTVSRKSTTGIIIIEARGVNDFHGNLRETLRLGGIEGFRVQGTGDL